MLGVQREGVYPVRVSRLGTHANQAYLGIFAIYLTEAITVMAVN